MVVRVMSGKATHLRITSGTRNVTGADGKRTGGALRRAHPGRLRGQ
ncbi:MAG: hypothetical protein ACREMA_04960 [Longimicrobiales bacterium]